MTLASRPVRLTLCAVAATISTVACISATSPLAAPPPGPHNVLFVGNSLTYTNDLPGTLVAIATMARDTVAVGAYTAAGVALVDHLNGATSAPAAIRAGGWQYVILQQGPTPAGVCRDTLALATRAFDSMITGAGAKTAVLMTWPYQGPLRWFAEVSTSFQTAATAVHGTLLPAGEAWHLALAADSTLSLYGPDGFHPGPLGTFLTALVIYEQVTGRDVRSLPAVALANGRPFTAPAATLRALQRAAHEANATWMASVMTVPPPASGAALMGPARTSAAQGGPC